MVLLEVFISVGQFRGLTYKIQPCHSTKIHRTTNQDFLRYPSDLILLTA